MNNAKQKSTGKSPLHKSLTPYANRRKSSTSGGCFAPFKAPVMLFDSELNEFLTEEEFKEKTPSKRDAASVKKNNLALAKQVVMLKESIDSCDKELEELERLYTEEELDGHIVKLHEYNDIKDVGQMLLGRLAEVEQTTTRSLYGRYGLELDD